MKKRLILVVILVITGITPVIASTSFAVYFQEPIYGFNLDWDDSRDVRLELQDFLGTTVLAISMQLDRTYGLVALFTDRGQLVTSQLQFPVNPDLKIKRSQDKGTNEIVGQELMMAHMMSYGLDAVLTQLEEFKFIHSSDFSFHHLFATQDDKAIIVEAGEDMNEVVFCDDQFIVMTNFRNSQFRYTPINEVVGEGADRYMKAHELIQAHRDKFDLDTTFEVLEATAQGSTVSSLAFLPKENSVYFTLFGDFDKIWKISLDARTIETYKGFSVPKKSPITQVGIFGSDLMRGVF